LKEQPHLTVHDSITGGSGNLSKAAQYLVVRFGLKPLLHRTVSTLSTGEIRKCLLVSALSKQPQLLVLENAFDGLDVSSRRELQSIVSKTIQGLGEKEKLLVTTVKAEHVPPASVFLSTHRPEEIPKEASTVSMVLSEDVEHAAPDDHHLVTIKRPKGWSEEQLMYMALGLDKDHNKNKANWSILAPWEIEDPTLPTVEELQDTWGSNNNDNETATTTGGPRMTLQDVEIRRRRDGITKDEELKQDEKVEEFVTLLQPISWEIQPGQRWLIAGGNGADKSTLSRFLLHHQMEEHDNNKHAGEEENDKDTTCDLTSGTYVRDPSSTIGWVSTESHVGQVTPEGDEPTATTAWDVITHNHTVPESVASQIVSSVFGNENEAGHVLERLLSCRLEELSQGQQKLALIASAMALRPKVLILDEPTQGLDWVNRRRVLTLLERLCQATDTSLIYITHYQEEWIPSISHVLHLEKGHILYQGSKRDYNPAQLQLNKNN
jgi:ABC-type molybdenum transport system ATPase subunit/photorepair protein PhrA